MLQMAASSLSHYRRLTTSACLYPSRLVQHPPDLIKWVHREGGFVHPSVKISENLSNGLGLMVSQDIPKGSDLIALPNHIPLKFQQDHDFSLTGLAQHVPEELWAMKLGLKLLQERAKTGSFWWPYISNLPETFTVPIFFPGEDIKSIQYAPLLHQVNKRCRFLLDFEKLVRHVLEHGQADDHPFSGQEVNASSLGWAMSAVSSRAFRLHGLKCEDGTHVDVPMLLPLIDMCNHSFTPNAEIVQGANDDDMLVKVIAREQIKQESELELNYGCLNSDLFLLDYGFVMSSNPYDHIELRYDSALLEAASMAAGISSPNFSSSSPWQKEILAQLNLEGENADLKVRIGGSEIVEDRLLAALRVLMSNEKEVVMKLDLNTLKSMSADAPVGTVVEAAVVRTVMALCAIALSNFPTKIMEDEALLKEKVSKATELAVQYRIQKKSVIIDAMRDLSRKGRLLSSKEQVV